MEPYIGEIRLFAGATYVPAGWLACDGQTLQVGQYQALFSIIGSTYGGDWQTTFMLPKLNGCVALGAGNGTGLTPRPWAKGGGEAEVVLSINQIPSHSHSVVCVSASATASSPTNNLWANVPRGQTAAYGATNDSSMGGLAVGQCGGNQAHNNMQPYLGLTYMIATEGVYPLKA